MDNLEFVVPCRHERHPRRTRICTAVITAADALLKTAKLPAAQIRGARAARKIQRKLSLAKHDKRVANRRRAKSAAAAATEPNNYDVFWDDDAGTDGDASSISTFTFTSSIGSYGVSGDIAEYMCTHTFAYNCDYDSDDSSDTAARKYVGRTCDVDTRAVETTAMFGWGSDDSSDDEIFSTDYIGIYR